MSAIWLNVILLLLYCEIAASDTRHCSEPNEEYKDLGCEMECKTGLSPCQSCNDRSERNLTSGCFCKKGTFRDPESNKCINANECTEKLCGNNQIFTEHFIGEKICPDDGAQMAYDAYKCITDCKCKEGFIRSCTDGGECITDAECEMRKTTPLTPPCYS